MVVRARTSLRLVPGLLVGLVLLSVANLVAVLFLVHERDAAAARPPPRDLPCPAVPMRLIEEDPACVNKLLAAMNVTNVRIVADLSEHPAFQPEAMARLRRFVELVTAHAAANNSTGGVMAENHPDDGSPALVETVLPSGNTE